MITGSPPFKGGDSFGKAKTGVVKDARYDIKGRQINGMVVLKFSIKQKVINLLKHFFSFSRKAVGNRKYLDQYLTYH